MARGRGKSCSLCTDARVSEMRAAGSSWRQIERELNYSHRQASEHAHRCLAKMDDTASARDLIKKNHMLLSGDLDQAFKAAEALRARAAESGDLVTVLRVEKNLTKLLQLRQKQIGRVPAAEVVTSGPRATGFRVVCFDLPEGLEGFASWCGQDEPPPEGCDVPQIGIRVRFQPQSKQEKSADAEAEQIESALRLYAEMTESKVEPN